MTRQTMTSEYGRDLVRLLQAATTYLEVQNCEGTAYPACPATSRLRRCVDISVGGYSKRSTGPPMAIYSDFGHRSREDKRIVQPTLQSFNRHALNPQLYTEFRCSN